MSVGRGRASGATAALSGLPHLESKINTAERERERDAERSVFLSGGLGEESEDAAAATADSCRISVTLFGTRERERERRNASRSSSEVNVFRDGEEQELAEKRSHAKRATLKDRLREEGKRSEAPSSITETE